MGLWSTDGKKLYEHGCGTKVPRTGPNYRGEYRSVASDGSRVQYTDGTIFKRLSGTWRKER